MEAIQGTSRVVVHFDVDAFYAQVEEVRDPSLKERPLGITQKYLIVTSNYPARKRGIAKLMGIQEAKSLCPDMVLINGEDLTPYRRASKRILAVLQRFGEAERLGMDEVLVDVSAVTEEAKARIAKGIAPPQYHGHVHSSQTGVVQENRHRVMDLRACTVPAGEVSTPMALDESAASWQLLLMVGSQIAAEARRAIKAEAGFRSSAGIACNRMLAKLSSGLHKPDDQTVLPPVEAAAFVAPLPLRALPGVGSKLSAELKDLGLNLVQDIVPWSRSSLVQKFGERIGGFLHLACRGEDPTPVKAKKPTKAITVEDSFKSCTTVTATKHILQILSPDLLARLHEEFQDEGRKPKTLTLKWRHRKNGFSRNSASCPLPSTIQVHRPPDSVQAEALMAAALALFSRNVTAPFSLSLLNLGATNFSDSAPAGRGIHAAFSRAQPKAARPPESAAESAAAGNGRRAGDAAANLRRDYGAAPSGAPISKTAERQLRETLNSNPYDQQPCNERLLDGADAVSSDASDVKLDGLSEEEGDQLPRQPQPGNSPYLNTQAGSGVAPRTQPGNPPYLNSQVGSGMASRRLPSFNADARVEGFAQERQADPIQQSQAGILQQRQAGEAQDRPARYLQQKQAGPEQPPLSAERPLAGNTVAASEHSERDHQAGIAPSCSDQEEMSRGNLPHLPVAESTWPDSRQAGNTPVSETLPPWEKVGQPVGKADKGPVQQTAWQEVGQPVSKAAYDPVQEELRRVRKILGKRGSSPSEIAIDGVSNDEVGASEQERLDAKLARRLQEEELGVRPKAQKTQAPRKGTLQTFFKRQRAS